MKLVTILLVLLSWVLAAAGLALWLFGSMFNDSPTSAAAYQKMMSSWPYMIVVSIALSALIYFVADPKARLAAAAVASIISLVLLMRPFSEMSAHAQQARVEAQNANAALLEEIRTKVSVPAQQPLDGAELKQTTQSLYVLIESQGEPALDVLRLALRNGVFPVKQWMKNEDVHYPDQEKKKGDEPQLNSIVFQKPNILKVYLEAGANLNEADTAFGRTPLMVAASLPASQETLEKIKLLLQNKARTQDKDLLGRSAQDHAKIAKEELKKEFDYLPPSDKSKYAENRRQKIETNLKIADEIIALLGQ